MKNVLVVMALLAASFQTVSADAGNEANSSKEITIPLFYKDYSWDIGLTGSMTMDGMQTEAERFSTGVGIHAAYHLDQFVSFHGEIENYFKTLTNDAATKDATNTIYALSAAFDFSAERTYSLYAKGGFGYEQQKKYNQQIDSPIALMGFGFRYMLTDSFSAYVEGRWKYVLVNRDTPDNSLIGTVGLDYHFGLSDEKSKLVDDVEKQNALLEVSK